MFKKKQQLKHLLSSIVAITSYKYFGLYSSQYNEY